MKALILFFLVQNSFACEVFSPEYLRVAPEKASLIATGKVKINKYSDKVTFIVNKQWTESLSEIYLFGDNSTACDSLGASSGQSYLLLNNYTIQSEESNRKGIAMSSAIIIELDAAQNIMDKLAEMKMENNWSNPAWEYCKRDEECVEAKNICKESVGVNKKYKDKYDHYVVNFLGNRTCPIITSHSSESKLKCINYFCGYEK